MTHDKKIRIWYKTRRLSQDLCKSQSPHWDGQLEEKEKPSVDKVTHSKDEEERKRNEENENEMEERRGGGKNRGLSG